MPITVSTEKNNFYYFALGIFFYKYQFNIGLFFLSIRKSAFLQKYSLIVSDIEITWSYHPQSFQAFESI